MTRRGLVVRLLGFVLSGCGRQTARVESVSEVGIRPEKIHLIPDRFHIQNVGKLSDGRLFFIDSQLDPNGGVTKDFVCTFVFDRNGNLVDHSIELIGERGKYPKQSVRDRMDRHLARLGIRAISDIWVKPFSVESNGVAFGLIPRQVPGGQWRVEFMPGNTLSFYPPWSAGGYDT